MSVLLQPMHIGNMELKNRIVLAPMGVTIGNMTSSTVDYFVERAKGGAAMIFCNIKGSATFESADHSACVVFHNLPPCRSPLFCIKKGSPPGSRFPDRRSLPDGTARVQTAHPAGIHVATGAATGAC